MAQGVTHFVMNRCMGDGQKGFRIFNNTTRGSPFCNKRVVITMKELLS